MTFSLESPTPVANTSERRFAIYLGLVALLIVTSVIRDFADRAGMFGGRLQRLSSFSEVAVDLVLLFMVCAASPVFIREMRRRRTTAVQAQQSRGQIELLFKMTDMLQSALGHADANSVLRATASSLLPTFGGALYTFNNSGDRLELSTSWHWPEAAPLSEAFSPSDCWAIKRGKLHLNQRRDEALCCDHYQSGLTTLEIPMMARGEVYGLLIVEQEGDNAVHELQAVSSVATALADAMSLSLSNLALRERLRTQALRDALTGLYNRRYMEDALERYMDQAARSQSPLSLVMIDLDHFKKLNDTHGHTMGDSVLAEVASAILGAIRPCDVACRFGGEELVLLLPDCSLEDAAAKADMLRSRIERLSERHGFPITASFGVSTVPFTSKSDDALSDADKALYRAKQEGRNRVAAAPPLIQAIATSPSIAA